MDEMTVSGHIRKRLLSNAHRLDSSSFDKLIITEWSPEFEMLMRNRLIIGSLRYDLKLKDDRPPGATALHIGYIKARLEAYEKTGNKEMLVDIANLCLIEFAHSDHPMSHFKAVDRT